ncbi:MAG: DUF58 domain-containing protein [Planctomycetaceae bacterium]
MSVPSRNGRSRRFGPWTEVLALLLGLLLVGATLAKPRLARGPLGFAAPLFLAAGLLLFGWGLLTLSGNLWDRVGGWAWRRTRRYRVHFHREALVYILILLVLCLGALLGHSNMLMLVFGLMAGPFVLAGQITRMILNRLHVSRVLPEYAVAGERFSVRLQLTNRKPLLSAWMVTAADRMENHREQQQPAVLFSRVPPKKSRGAAYSVRPAQRGVYRFGPVRVMCSFPLGLMERSFELGETAELTVLPRIGRLTERWRARERSGQQPSHASQARLGVSDDEFHRLREYRGGDNPRAIHWRTTARRNELMVREYQHQRWPELCLVVELWQPNEPVNAELERVERALSFVASLCVDHARGSEDAALRVVICGARSQTFCTTGHSASLRTVLEELAVAEAGAAPDLAPARDAAAAVNSSARRILVTSRWRDATGPGGQPAETGSDGGLASFEIVHADVTELASYLDFSHSAGVSTP